MERIPRAIYTKELREEAVKLIREGGLSIPEVGHRLSVAASTLRYWVKADREGKRPGAGLIHHSDRGRQYCAHEYRKLMDQFKMRASMSRKGDCYDNAPMESFWGAVKNELIHHCRYKTRE